MRLMVAAFAFTILLAAGAQAATFTVNSTGDGVDATPGNGVCETAAGNGVCTLRAAVGETNALASDDTINFAAGITTILVPTAEIDINPTGTLTITGPGANVLTIDGVSSSVNRIFQYSGGAAVTITDVTLTGGNSGFGGAIYDSGGSSLTLDRVHITGNTTTSFGGAGVYFGRGTNFIRNSTFSNNINTGNGSGGGGFFGGGDAMTVVNTTVSDNTSKFGGGIYVNASTSTTLRNVTVVNNSASGASNSGGGGIYNGSNFPLDLGNTIVANNSIGAGSTGTGPNILGAYTDSGGNFVGTTTTLDPLANYGGTTPTIRLQTGSPLIDAGVNALATGVGLTTDQRGLTRIADGNGDGSVIVDIGAYEVQAPTSATYTVNSTDDTTDAAIDGVCETAAGNGVCTLRAAIQEANATAIADNIGFNLIGTGVQTITLGDRLPDISNPVTIDGYTQPGSSVNTLAVGNNAVLRIQITTNINVDRFFTTFGGSATLRGLIINGYNTYGVAFFSSNNNIIEGCFVGTNADGTARGSLANQSTGILISVGSPNAIGTLVGGTTPASRNLISGNASFGINAGGVHVIQNNYIGTNAAGTGAIPNGGFNTAGVAAGSGTTIGGAGANLRNVISGNNGSGISLSGNNLTKPVFVLGNYIGTAVDGVTPLGNAGDGITLSTTAGNQIGNGTTTGANVIANNGGAGILNAGNNGFAVANRISVNSIYSNGGLGIDLSNTGTSDGVTINDAGDADTGANNLQNFPVITSVMPGSTLIQGTFNSTPNTVFRLEFFSVPTADASGFGEGQTFVGTANVTTDGNGDATYNLSFAPTTPAGQFVTATATDPSGNTSEFSQAVVVSPAAPTAAEVMVSGRVMRGGRGLARTLVLLTDAGGVRRTAMTNVFGYYRFQKVPVGETYIFSVKAKRYESAPQVVYLTEERGDLNFNLQ